MAGTAVSDSPAGLRRSVGFWGLLFLSLGSIIGSGWLLGALEAATTAGPASLISWGMAAIMLTVLALIHAELGTSYPTAGGTARYPYFAFGNLTGFVAGWTAWLQAVTLAPIEVEASLTYLQSTQFAKHHLRMLHPDKTLNLTGIGVAALGILLFTIINLIGAKLLSDSNGATVIWKTAIPVLTIVVLMTLSFHASNFHAGGFAPFGGHGVFAALPVGVVFSLQGFEQAVQFGGEAKNPQKDISRAVIVAMLLGAAIYILLEVCFIGALNPANIAHGWANPIGKGDYGPYHDLAIAAGAGWLAALLVVDAVISPAGTGLVYLGTSARLSYAMGQEEEMPAPLTAVNRRGVPWVSVLLATVVGLILFLPFPSWQSLVKIVTSATAIMYAFGPVSLAALRKADPDRERPYRMPAPSVLLPLGFAFANLIIYCTGFETVWKLDVAILFGLLIFFIGAISKKTTSRLQLHGFTWVLPWLAGLTVISLLGRYGTGALKVLPDWIDAGVALLYGLVVFFWTQRFQQAPAEVERALQADRNREQEMAELNVSS